MAEGRITKDSVSEQNPFEYLINSGEQGVKTLMALDAELNKVAASIKGAFGNIGATKSLGDINKIVSSSAMVNKLAKDAIALEKAKLQLDKESVSVELTRSRQRQQESRERVQLAREKQNETRATEKQTRAESAQSSAYLRISRTLTKLRAEYRDLAIRKSLDAKLTVAQEAKLAVYQKRITMLDSALKKVDAGMGQYQRSVGDYASGWNGLSNAINQITREGSAFVNSLQTGFLAISNNLPTLTDELSKLNKQNKELAAQGKPTTSVLRQVAGSFFTLGTAISLGVTLLTAFGAKAIESIGTFLTQDKALTANIAKWKELAAQYRETGKAAEETQKINNKLSDFTVQYLEAIGAKESEILRQRGINLANFHEQQVQILADAAAEQRYLVRLLNTDLSDDERKEYSSRLDELKQFIKDQAIEFRSFDVQNKILRAQLRSALQKEAEDEAKARKERAKKQRDEVDKTNEYLLDAELQRINNLRTVTSNYYEQSLALFKDNADAQIDIMLDRNLTMNQIDKAERDVQLKIVQNTYAKLIAEAEGNAKQITALEAKRDAEIDRINIEFNNRRTQRENETDEAARLRREKQLEEAKEDAEKEAEQVLDAYEETYKKRELEILNESEENNEEFRRKNLENEIDYLEKKRAETARIEGETSQEVLDIDIELAKKRRELREDEEKRMLEARKALNKQLQDLAKNVAEYESERIQKNIDRLDEEIAKREENFQHYQALVVEGNINAEQSLKEQQRLIEEANQRKQQEERKQQVIKVFTAGLEAYAKTGDLPNTVSDITKLLAFLNAITTSLPAFYDGTEDTGNPSGGGVDGKGGFHAILHPEERVIPRKINKMIPKSMSNVEAGNVLHKYSTGALTELPKNDKAGTSYDLLALSQQVADLSKAIAEKPDVSIEAGKIISGAMEIIETTKHKNRITINRYITR